MKYRVHHVTTYRYADEFASCHSQVHLVPRDLDTQKCISSEILIEPHPDMIYRHLDAFGNIVESFTLHTPSAELEIHAISQVELTVQPLPSYSDSLPWEQVRDLLASESTDAPLDVFQYVFDSPYVEPCDAAEEYALKSFVKDAPILEAARHLMNRIFTDFKFDPESTDVGTSVAEVFASKRGVCQDFAHIMIACLRSLGLPARYVSGYLRTDPAPGKKRLVGADASHAWCATWSLQSGWVGFDPTNDCIPTDRHLTLAWGRDYGDVSPVRGVVIGGGKHQVKVSVDVSLEENNA